jgi:ribosome biogenesis GTPase
MRGTVLAREGSHFQVLTPDGTVAAVLRGRIKRHDDRALVGDRVTLESSATGWAITAVDPRRNTLGRREPGRRKERPVAANIDLVCVMAATRDPEPVPQLVDRLLVLAEADDIPAAVVVNKIDLDSGAGFIERMEHAGYQVFPVSVRQALGLERLFERLHGGVSLVTGPSGVGKSSLLNALQPGLGLRTAEVSQRIRRGRNTTVTARMIPIEGGGCLVDTPGLSDVGLWGLEPRELAQCFPDLRRALGACKFPDCRHRTEPGCRVRDQVGREILPDRYQSYLAFLAELEALPKEWS